MTRWGCRRRWPISFLFTLAPGLFFLWHLLGLFGTDPAKLHEMLGVLKAFLPPDPKVQDILDSQVASVVVTGSSGITRDCRDCSWHLFWNTFSSRRSLRRSVTPMACARIGIGGRNTSSRFLLLFWFGITILVCFNAIVFGETLAGIAEVNFQLRHPAARMGRGPESAIHRSRADHSRARALPAHPGKLSHDWPGLPRRGLFSLGWMTVTKLFQSLCREIRSLQSDLSRTGVDHCSALTWMYLTCLLLLLGGKIKRHSTA